MYKLQIKARVSNRKELYFANDNLLKMLDEGNYVVTFEKQQEPKTIEEYRKEYFAKRDVLASETGNQKQAVHSAAKFKFLEGCSTTTLSVEGWQQFIKDFKEWGFEHFNCVL